MRRVAQQCSAARAVDHEKVRPAAEGGSVPGDELARCAPVPRVLVQRSAALLVLDLDDPIAVGLQGSAGRIVHAPEERIHNAAPEESHRAAGTLGRVVRGQGAVARERSLP